MSQPVQGTISAAGVAGAFVNNLVTPDTLLLLEVSGAYTGLTLVFEALPQGGNPANNADWFPVGGVQQDIQATVSGTSASPLVAGDGLSLGFKFDVTACVAFRVWAKALTAGPVTVKETSGSFFPSPVPGVSYGTALQLATLWQLQHLTFLVAEGLGQGANFVQNPLLPAGLLPATWDVTG